MPIRNTGHSGHRLPGQPPPVDYAVPGDVPRGQPKERPRSSWIAAGAGFGQLQNHLPILYKLPRAMVRLYRDRLAGIEGDETYWSGEEPEVIGRAREEKALIVLAAQEDGTSAERIRLGRIPDLTRAHLHGFIARVVEPGSTVRIDGLMLT